MDQEKVSIVIPVYNVEQLLPKCVDSILEQTHKNTEIILVNDGSTDDSLSICESYAKKHKNIIVENQKNAGQSAARNTGLKHITGDYLFFVDSDDWIDKNTISVLLKLLKEHNAQVVECDLSYSNLPETHGEFDENKCDVKIESRIEALKRIIENQRFSVCVRLYDAKTVKGINFVVGKNAPDVYYTCEVFNRTDKNIYINYPFYKYLYNPTSITKKPYTLKKLDSLDAAIFLRDNVKDNHPLIQKAIASNLLYASTYHYRYINYYPKLDKDWAIRKRLKKLINENYFSEFNNSLSTKAARFLPPRIFSFILGLNNLAKNR